MDLSRLALDVDDVQSSGETSVSGYMCPGHEIDAQIHLDLSLTPLDRCPDKASSDSDGDDGWNSKDGILFFV